MADPHTFPKMVNAAGPDFSPLPEKCRGGLPFPLPRRANHHWACDAAINTTSFIIFVMYFNGSFLVVGF
jgi:hypothetical protein